MKPIVYAMKLERLLTVFEAGVLSRAAEDEAVTKYKKHPEMPNANMSLAGSALMRVAAAKALGVPAERVSIQRDNAGKPYIKESGLFVSLSHSKDLCVCAVCDRPVGVDVEFIKETFPDRIAEKYFSFEERKRLETSGEIGEAASDYIIWTRKESVLKCTGEGLSAISSVSEDGFWIKSGIIFGEYALSICVKDASENS